MKKYTTKRALAGVLAVLTVAGSAPANVGGLLFAANSAIVASAEDVATSDLILGGADDELWRFVSSIEFDGETVSNITKTKAKSYPITDFTDVTVKTTIPMTFAYNGTDASGTADAITIAVADIKTDGGNSASGVYGYDATTKKYYSTTALASIEGKTEGEDYIEIGGTNYAIADEDDVKSDAIDTLFADDKNITKNDIDELAENLTVNETTGAITLGIVETAKPSVSSGTYTYKFKTSSKPILMSAVTVSANVWNGYAAGDLEADHKFGPTGKKVDSTDADKGATTVENLTVKRTVGGKAIAPGDNNAIGTEVDNVFQNEEITLTAKTYFEAWVWDGESQTTVTQKFSELNKDGDYEIKVNALTTTKKVGDVVTNNNTQILVQTATPSYTFELTNQDTVLKTKGAVATEAASITGKGYAYDSETEKPATKGTDLATAADALANGSKVAVTLKRVDAYTAKDNARYAQVKITRDGKELAEDAMVWVKKKDDAQIAQVAYSTIKKWDVSPDETLLEFYGAGEYKVEYTVYVSEKKANVSTPVISDKTMTYEFEISKRNEPTAKNVTMKAANGMYSTFKDILKTDGTNIKDAKLVDGVFVFELKEGKSLGGKTFKVDADLFTTIAKKTEFAGKDKENLADGYDEKGNKIADTWYTVSGSTSVSSANKVQSVTITYSDPEITAGEQTLTLKWKVAEAAKTVTVIDAELEEFMLTDGNNENFDLDDVAWDEADVESHSYDATNGKYPYKPGDYTKKVNYSTLTYTYNGITTSLDEIDTLEQKVMDSFIVINGTKDNISFEYVEGSGVQLKNDELDTHYEGLPNKVGDYSVYVLYKGKAVNVIDLHISEHGLYAAPTEEQLNFTYGTKLFDSETLAYKNSSGKKVKDVTVKNLSINYVPLYAVSKANQKYIQDGKLESLDVYVIDGVSYTVDRSKAYGEDAIYNGDNFTAGPSDTGTYLGAGHWLVTVSQQSSTKFSKEGYSFATEKFIVNVAQKEITKDMILIDPARYTGKSVTLKSSAIHGTDIDLDTDIKADRSIALKVADGNEKGKEIKSEGYGITIAPDDTEKNYTGSVKTAWYIVYDTEYENLTDLDWNDDETTIYNADGAIYVKATRPADSAFSGTVVDYGFIWEAQGKLDMPTFINEDSVNTAATGQLAGKPIATRAKLYDDNKAMGGIYAFGSTDAGVKAAYTALQYGNGTVSSQSQSPKATDKQVATAVIYVKNANTGVWVRPYAVEKSKEGDLSISYGEPRYINIVDEATKCLNLATAEPGSPSYDVQECANTRATAYAKATSTNKKNKKYREDVKAGFNEKTGSFYVYSYYNLKTTKTSKLKEEDIKRFGYVCDANASFEAKDVAKKLKVDSGFAQGLANPKNPVLDPDEAGASIFAKSSVNTLYSRTFVDFGNDIVVYTDAVAIKSVSEQFKKAQPTLSFADLVKETGKYGIYSDFKTAANAPTKFEDSDDCKSETKLKKIGIVADFKGSFLETDSATGKYTLIEDAKINEKLTIENATKSSGYLVGKVEMEEDVITGSCESYKKPETDAKLLQIPAVARTYAIWEINGNEIAVYGAPFVFRGDENYKGSGAGTRKVDLGDQGEKNVNVFYGLALDDAYIQPPKAQA